MPITYEVQVSHDAPTPAGRGAAPQAPAGDGAARHGSRPWAGPALMFGGALSNQLGAATGALAFGVIGPAGVVAIPPWVAGVVLLARGGAPGGPFDAGPRRPGLPVGGGSGTL